MQTKKIIITVSGIILFLIAGTITMFFMPSENLQSEQKIIANEEQNIITPEKINIWYVYVTGAVKKPGVYKLSEDSRIFSAIEAAGGFSSKADTGSINLAELLADGMHVHVQQKGSKISPPPSANNAVVNVPGRAAKPDYIQILGNANTKPQQNNNNAGLVDINHASEIELQKLKGVGPAISRRIIEYRNQHGRFNSAEDLINVKGIGSAKLEKMRAQILIR